MHAERNILTLVKTHENAPPIGTRRQNNPPGTQTTINHHYDGGEEQDDRIIRWAIVVENTRKRNGFIACVCMCKRYVTRLVVHE